MNKNAKTALVPKLRFPEFRDSGEWEENLIKDFAQVTTGNKDTQNKIDNGKYPFFVRSQTVERIDTYTFDCEAILTSGDGVGVGKNFHYIVGKFDFHQRVYCIYDFQKGVFGKFVYYYFSEFFQKHIMKLSAKNSVDSVRMSMITDMSMFVPSYKEQQKIADCLSSLDDLISTEGKKLEALNEHKKGLMQKLFPAEGKTVPELRFPEFIDSGEWEEKKLGIICNILQGYGFPIEMQGKSNSKYSFYKVSDISYAFVNSGGILVKAANSIDVAELAVLKAKIIPKGTTVFAKIGEALKANKRAFTTADCLIDNNVVGIKAKSNATQDYFIFLLSQLFDLGEHCGGVIPSVSKTALENIKIPFIKNHEEQQKIADCLSSLDDLIATEGKKLEELNKHKKGLMQGLFPSVAEVDEWM